MVTPAFHFKILEDFVEVFNAVSDVLLKKLRKELGKDSFDVFPYFNLFALDVICGKSKPTYAMLLLNLFHFLR